MSKNQRIALWLASPYLLIIAAICLFVVGGIAFPPVETADSLFGEPSLGMHIVNILCFLMGAAGIIFIPVSVIKAIKIHAQKN